MAKECKDFTFLGKSLSDLSEPYISVDFDSERARDFALSRSIEYADTVSSRTEPSIRKAALDGHLTFEIHLIKDPDCCLTENDRIFTETQTRELARWLTSTDTSQFLRFTYENAEESDTCLFYGQFTDIQPFLASGELYGLRLTFECATCYGYTDEIVTDVHCQGSTLVSILNHSDDLNRCRYPKIHLEHEQTGQAYLVNLSDCHIYEDGMLPDASGNEALMELLKGKVEAYALNHGLEVHYRPDPLGDTKVVTIGNNTAIQFYFADSDGSLAKCAAFYRETTRSYYIIEGGFLCLNVKKSLPVHMDCEHVTLFDDIGRMITYESIGMNDVDYFYWPRLLSGENTYFLYAPDCRFTFTHRELRKAGA